MCAQRYAYIVSYYIRRSEVMTIFLTTKCYKFYIHFFLPSIEDVMYYMSSPGLLN